MKRILIMCVAAIAMTQGVSSQPVKKLRMSEVPATMQFIADEPAKNLAMQLALPDGYTFEPVGAPEVDEQGVTHERLRQYYHNIVVEPSDLRLHHRDGLLLAAHGEYVDATEVDLTPLLSEAEAVAAARSFVGSQLGVPDDQLHSYLPQAELVIGTNRMDPADHTLHLCYKIDLYCLEQCFHQYVYVDAQSGLILNQLSLIHHSIGTAHTRYSGTRQIATRKLGSHYVLHDTLRGGGIRTYDLQHNWFPYVNMAVDFTDNDNFWSYTEYHNANRDDGALDAHWGAMMTYDYFQQVHGRNSYDNQGSPIINLVHLGTNYPNAGWYPTLEVMAYGDGDSYYDILTALDIIGHEIGHGVCQYTADLVYQGEPGAINESLSDIWGACIEQWATNDKQTWLMGEDIATPLRSMEEPKLYGCPDTYGGEHWIDPDSSFDYGGVHINSGVMNRWFFLLCEGGAGTNDYGNSYHVDPIGIDNAATIVYRAESVYMTSGTQFIDARTHTIQAAIDLFGPDSPEVQSVKDAWYAVGVWTDLYVRDCPSDNGLTPSTCGSVLWNSPDIWVEDLNGQPVLHPNGNSDYYVCVRIHNDHDYPSSGGERLLVNWAKAGTGLFWSRSWSDQFHFNCNDGQHPMGGVAGLPDGLLLPPIPAHSSYVARMPWHTPMAEDYAGCTQFAADLWHFCLMARLHDDEPVLGEDQLNLNLSIFVPANNNVAWKNLSLNSASSPSVVIGLSNHLDWMEPFRLRLRCTHAATGALLHEHADVFLRLDDDLYEAWQAGGAIVEGAEPTEKGFLLTGEELMFDGLMLEPDRIYTIETEVWFHTEPPEGTRYLEYDIVQEWNDEVVGGQHYLATWYDDEQLFPPKDDDPENTDPEGTMLLLAPNPTSGHTTVHYRLPEGMASATLVVTSLNSHELHRSTLTHREGSHMLDLQSAAPGQYLVRIESSGALLALRTLLLQ